MPGWVQKIVDGKSVFIPKEKARVKPRLQVVPDIPDYTSPVDGRLVSGRKQRREDLKRNGCVEYDPGMRETAVRRRDEMHQAAVDKLVDRMRWHNA